MAESGPALDQALIGRWFAEGPDGRFEMEIVRAGNEGRIVATTTEKGEAPESEELRLSPRDSNGRLSRASRARAPTATGRCFGTSSPRRTVSLFISMTTGLGRRGEEQADSRRRRRSRQGAKFARDRLERGAARLYPGYGSVIWRPAERRIQAPPRRLAIRASARTNYRLVRDVAEIHAQRTQLAIQVRPLIPTRLASCPTLPLHSRSCCCR